jgi:hypothetical protein
MKSIIVPTITENNAREFVVECLHHNGIFAKHITKEEHYRAYCLCDGFGKLDADDLKTIGYDWSHVRDSSDATFLKVAKYLSFQIQKRQCELHKTVVDFALKHKISISRSGKHGHYYIGDDFSLTPTAKSGIILMKRYLRRKAA